MPGKSLTDVDSAVIGMNKAMEKVTAQMGRLAVSAGTAQRALGQDFTREFAEFQWFLDSLFKAMPFDPQSGRYRRRSGGGFSGMEREVLRGTGASYSYSYETNNNTTNSSASHLYPEKLEIPPGMQKLVNKEYRDYLKTYHPGRFKRLQEAERLEKHFRTNMGPPAPEQQWHLDWLRGERGRQEEFYHKSISEQISPTHARILPKIHEEQSQARRERTLRRRRNTLAARQGLPTKLTSWERLEQVIHRLTNSSSGLVRAFGWLPNKVFKPINEMHEGYYYGLPNKRATDNQRAGYGLRFRNKAVALGYDETDLQILGRKVLLPIGRFISDVFSDRQEQPASSGTGSRGSRGNGRPAMPPSMRPRKYSGMGAYTDFYSYKGAEFATGYFMQAALKHGSAEMLPDAAKFHAHLQGGRQMLPSEFKALALGFKSQTGQNGQRLFSNDFLRKLAKAYQMANEKHEASRDHVAGLRSKGKLGQEGHSANGQEATKRAQEAVGGGRLRRFLVEALRGENEGAKNFAKSSLQYGGMALNAASPDAFATLTGSFKLLSAVIGSELVPDAYYASRKIQGLAKSFQNAGQGTKALVGLGSALAVFSGAAFLVLPQIVTLGRLLKGIATTRLGGLAFNRWTGGLGIAAVGAGIAHTLVTSAHGKWTEALDSVKPLGMSLKEANSYTLNEVKKSSEYVEANKRISSDPEHIRKILRLARQASREYNENRRYLAKAMGVDPKRNSLFGSLENPQKLNDKKFDNTSNGIKYYADQMKIRSKIYLKAHKELDLATEMPSPESMSKRKKESIASLYKEAARYKKDSLESLNKLASHLGVEGPSIKESPSFLKKYASVTFESHNNQNLLDRARDSEGRYKRLTAAALAIQTGGDRKKYEESLTKKFPQYKEQRDQKILKAAPLLRQFTNRIQPAYYSVEDMYKRIQLSALQESPLQQELIRIQLENLQNTTKSVGFLEKMSDRIADMFGMSE